MEDELGEHVSGQWWFGRDIKGVDMYMYILVLCRYRMTTLTKHGPVHVHIKRRCRVFCFCQRPKYHFAAYMCFILTYIYLCVKSFLVVLRDA